VRGLAAAGEKGQPTSPQDVYRTYQAGKLFFLGLKPDGRMWVFERTFNRCMGLWGDGETLWLSSLYQLWRFENALAPGELYQSGDRLYVPRVGYTTKKKCKKNE
jgi:uncharacterized protein (TIGR03032 family)